MKLYYIPGACSLSPHIVLREAGFEFELEKVENSSKRTASGQDFNAVNPKSQVPVLELDDQQRLTEVAAIVQYLADRKPECGLAPQAGTLERARLQEWLNFVASEMHKAYYPLFHPEVGKEAQAFYLNKLKSALSYVAERLADKPYLMGAQFSVADAYLFTVLNWHKFVNLDLSPWPGLMAYQERVASRPAVQAALRAEGLA